LRNGETTKEEVLTQSYQCFKHKAIFITDLVDISAK